MSHSIEVYSSCCYPYDEGQCTPDHAHSEVYQVFFCVDGEDHRTYGKKHVVVHKGEFLLVPKGQSHSMKRCKGITLDIKFGVFDELLAEQLQLLIGHACSTAGTEYLIEQIMTLTDSEVALSFRLISLYLETVFCTLLSNMLCDSKPGGDENEADVNPHHMKASKSIMQMLPFMEHFVINPLAPFSIETWSKEGGYSQKYLYRQFSRETGISPTKYFNQLRVNRAKHFLEFSDMKVTDIARILGYGDTRHFVKYFKKKVWTRVFRSNRRNKRIFKW